MANDVFANGREVSCKKAAGKSTCSFPDVCFTPPENPATPPGVPLPYPNTGFARDTTDGSNSVKISDREVMLKNKSYFKKSIGDEAGCAAKKGFVNSTHRGKVYFIAWSMDVKAEGENIVRHLDMTTHNHASPMANEAVPWPYVDQQALAEGGACHKEYQKEKKACEGDDNPCPPDAKPESEAEANALADKVAENLCLEARRCKLVPYDPSGCCKGQTPHHIVEASSFFDVGRGGSKTLERGGEAVGYRTSVPVNGTAGYSTAKAPCICVEGTGHSGGTHGLMHTYQGTAAQNSAISGTLEYDCTAVDLTKASRKGLPQIRTDVANRGFHRQRVVYRKDGEAKWTAQRAERVTTYGKAKQQGIAAVQAVFPESDCSKECLEAQLDNYHRQKGINDDTRIRSCEAGRTGPEHVDAARQAVTARSQRTAQVRAGQPTGNVAT